MMTRRMMIGLVAGAAMLLSLVGGQARAQEVKLKLHFFLPPKANLSQHVIEPW
ncbi:MAG TPA: C4-dicarboxylate ABC transporter, partial [Aliiroseovarius sp.]|nr:C4-dicarboxylate ABC transporter [Aliiroseovarius sp.]